MRWRRYEWCRSLGGDCWDGAASSGSGWTEHSDQLEKRPNVINEKKSTWWFSVDFNIYWPKNTLMLRWSLIFVLLCWPTGSIFLCNSLPLEVVEQKSFKDIIWRDIFLDISFMFTMHMHFLAWLLFFKKASVCQYHCRKRFYLLRPDRHSSDLIRPACRCGPISKLPDFCQQ